MVNPDERYIPDRGHIVYLDFNPTKGHEQRGHRPAFVISPRLYNEKSFLALFMPMTRQQKGYPFEVPLTPDLQIQGVILADQIKCLDWAARNVQFVESVPKSLVEAVQVKVEPLISWRVGTILGATSHTNTWVQPGNDYWRESIEKGDRWIE